MLIAQATVERAALVSADEALAAYGIRVVWRR
jgi:PIN domain nuclease of toxin-antitoxin system